MSFRVDGIEVGTLLPVHLDVDEVIIQQEGSFLVFKGLMRHDMTPVTRRVTNTQEYWLVFCSSTCQSLITPRIPIYWVLCVLKQIWARFLSQTIRLFQVHHKLPRLWERWPGHTAWNQAASSRHS